MKSKILRAFSNSDRVRIFMERVGHVVNQSPTFPNERTQKLGMLLLEEELAEFYTALAKKDMVGVADGLTDILYVVYGIGHNFGIDLDYTFDAVHESNMSKLDVNGKAQYNKSGKVRKGKYYVPPDIKGVLSDLK
jgi:predicted HAD superfamily Cof-like phosphohydrolase